MGHGRTTSCPENGVHTVLECISSDREYRFVADHRTCAGSTYWILDAHSSPPPHLPAPFVFCITTRFPFPLSSLLLPPQQPFTKTPTNPSVPQPCPRPPPTTPTPPPPPFPLPPRAKSSSSGHDARPTCSCMTYNLSEYADSDLTGSGDAYYRCVWAGHERYQPSPMASRPHSRSCLSCMATHKGQNHLHDFLLHKPKETKAM